MDFPNIPQSGGIFQHFKIEDIWLWIEENRGNKCTDDVILRKGSGGNNDRKGILLDELQCAQMQGFEDHRAGFKRGSWDPGSQEIIKTYKKSLLELMHPGYKNKFLLIRIINWQF